MKIDPKSPEVQAKCLEIVSRWVGSPAVDSIDGYAKHSLVVAVMSNQLLRALDQNDDHESAAPPSANP